MAKLFQAIGTIVFWAVVFFIFTFFWNINNFDSVKNWHYAANVKTWKDSVEVQWNRGFKKDETIMYYRK